MELEEQTIERVFDSAGRSQVCRSRNVATASRTMAGSGRSIGSSIVN
jgi:hypothetical protein